MTKEKLKEGYCNYKINEDVKEVASIIFDNTFYHIITINLEIWKKDVLKQTYNIDLNLEIMGLDINDNFDYIISKEMCNYVNSYMYTKNKIPTMWEIQKHLEVIR
ncbi:MAG: hypothetical protein WC343_02845 [Bacilli bacterium]|jgi:hypothetical protein